MLGPIDCGTIEAARIVPLLDAAVAAGAVLRRQGSEHVGPCPACGGQDRFAVNPTKNAWSCRPGNGGRDAIGLRMHVAGEVFPVAVGSLTGRRADVSFTPSPGMTSLPRPRPIDNAKKAQWLWQRSEPAVGTIAEGYLRGARAIRSPIPPTIRFLPSHGEHPPAMIAAFAEPNETSDAMLSPAVGRVRAVHLTPLTSCGCGKAGHKRMIGSPGGHPIVLSPWDDGMGLFVVAGIEDAMSALDAVGCAVWATGSGPHMAGLAPLGDEGDVPDPDPCLVPPWCDCVMIVADDNETDRHGAARLAQGLERRGHGVRVCTSASGRAGA